MSVCVRVYTSLSIRRNLLRLPTVADNHGGRHGRRKERKSISRALVRERVIYVLIMQQPRFITGDTRCLADSEIEISRGTDLDGAELCRVAPRPGRSCPFRCTLEIRVTLKSVISS